MYSIQHSLTDKEIINCSHKLGFNIPISIFPNILVDSGNNIIDQIILYRTKPLSGHWVLIFNNNKGNIEYFDSYGYTPDEAININSKKMNKILKMTIPFLNLLLLKFKNTEYNDKKYQADNSSTCGKWVLIRYLLKNLNDKEFSKLFYTSNKEYNDIVLNIFFNKLIN